MAKPRISDPIVRNSEVKEALGDAFTRALHWAPDEMLEQFMGEHRAMAGRRLAIRVIDELEADGWRELRPRLDRPDMTDAIAAGLKKAGKTVLGGIPAAKCCNGKMLDTIGFHFGELTFDAMKKLDVSLSPNITPSLIDAVVYRRREAG